MTLRYFAGQVFTSEPIHILPFSLDCGHMPTKGVGEYTRFENDHVVWDFTPGMNLWSGGYCLFTYV